MTGGVRRIGNVLVLALACVVLVTLPVSASSRGQSNGLRPNWHVVLRVAGTRVIGRMLLPQLLVHYLLGRGDSQVEVEPGQSPWNVVVSGVTPFGVTEVIPIKFVRQATAYDELRSGQVDLAMMMRTLTATEKAALLPPNRNGATGVIKVLLGKVGGAVLVNPSNPIKSLTAEQIAGIFTGRIRNWSQVGGRSGKIQVYLGSQPGEDEVLLSTLDAGPAVAPGAIHKSAYPPFAWPVRPPRESALAQAVAADPYAIAFMLQPFASNLKVVGIRSPIGVNYLPSPDAVSTGDYALRAHLYLFARRDKEASVLDSFLGSLNSTTRTVATILAGLEPPDLALLADVPRTGVPQAYRSATLNGLRISQTIYFPDSTGKITPRVTREIDRVARFLTRLEVTHGGLRLLAFTNPGKTLSESEHRSFALGEIVDRELEKHLIRGTEVYGMGDVMPLAPASSEKLRALNRRVEVWFVP